MAQVSSEYFTKKITNRIIQRCWAVSRLIINSMTSSVRNAVVKKGRGSCGRGASRFLGTFFSVGRVHSRE